jgi:hypothetical protein
MAERETLQKKLSLLTDQVASIERLLEAENTIWEKVNPPLFVGSDNGQQGTALSQMLLDVLRSKNGIASLDELKEVATQRGVPFGDKHPGRVIHFALLGMGQHKLVRRLADGRWELVKESNVN